MTSDLYSVWGDPAFYAAAAVFSAGMFFLVFSIRKYLEMENRSGLEEAVDEDGAEASQADLPLEAAAEPLPSEEAPAGPAPVREPERSGPPAGDLPHSSKAEEFVKGLYASLASLDGRLKNIEAAFSKSGVNKDFAVNFLEDILSDFDSLEKEKIKARIEYLVSDLKK
ncbi:MAG TPA: hypothetical protein PL037_04825 [Elusimicrobiales bacterium]|nr:hypothetical protein [Elusimicrobiales bacterium]